MTNEIFVDNFAGGGGASTGIEMAIGRSVDIAINHDPAAIAMHKANHPATKHYCESVWDVDPVEACAGHPVALAWFSPDCKHFSKAKGGKPKSKNIRGLAWVAVKWAQTVKPRVIILENVEEFQEWGPLRKDGHPDKRSIGKTFNRFVYALRRYGYKVEWCQLRACDYGAPTTRNRFFLIARCDNKRIIWPEPTHGDPDSWLVRCGLELPYRTAAEIINWDIPCPSIFWRKKPLCENTMKRIAKGMKKFVLDNPKPYIVPVGDGIICPTIIQYHGEKNPNEVRGQSIEKPLNVVDASNRYGLVTAFMMHYYGASIGAPVTAPLGTITAQGEHIAAIQAFLIKYYGTDIGQSIKDPLHTITSKDRFGLVMVQGLPYQVADIGMRMLTPRELFDAQGFPHDYIIDRDADGNKYPKTAQVARCGNAVPPQFAEALTRANLPEYCPERIKIAG